MSKRKRKRRGGSVIKGVRRAADDAQSDDAQSDDAQSDDAQSDDGNMYQSNMGDLIDDAAAIKARMVSEAERRKRNVIGAGVLLAFLWYNER